MTIRARLEDIALLSAYLRDASVDTADASFAEREHLFRLPVYRVCYEQARAGRLFSVIPVTRYPATRADIVVHNVLCVDYDRKRPARGGSDTLLRIDASADAVVLETRDVLIRLALERFDAVEVRDLLEPTERRGWMDLGRPLNSGLRDIEKLRVAEGEEEAATPAQPFCEACVADTVEAGIPVTGELIAHAPSGRWPYQPCPRCGSRVKELRRRVTLGYALRWGLWSCAAAYTIAAVAAPAPETGGGSLTVAVTALLGILLFWAHRRRGPSPTRSRYRVIDLDGPLEISSPHTRSTWRRLLTERERGEAAQPPLSTCPQCKRRYFNAYVKTCYVCGVGLVPTSDRPAR